MKTTYGPITLEPLTGTIGAEIVTGATIGPLDDETVIHLHQAWVDWKVLFFRDQHVSVEDHIAFGRQFGELEVHPFLPNNGHPEIVVLDTANDGPSRAERWHTDVTFREAPPTGSVLRGRIIPPVGGDTLWADMEQAYEQLDDTTKERIEHLTATHTLRTSFGRRLSPEELEQKLTEYPDQHHPVVRVHPVTGRRSLFVNDSFTEQLDDIDPDEGRRAAEPAARHRQPAHLPGAVPLAHRFVRHVGQPQHPTLRRPGLRRRSPPGRTRDAAGRTTVRTGRRRRARTSSAPAHDRPTTVRDDTGGAHVGGAERGPRHPGELVHRLHRRRRAWHARRPRAHRPDL